jgi:Na+/H+ antiporter NhaC
VIALWLFAAAPVALAQEYEIEMQDLLLTHVRFDVPVSVTGDTLSASAFSVEVDGERYPVETASDGSWVARNVRTLQSGTTEVRLLRAEQTVRAADVRTIPGWLSILPPVIAIAIALAFKRVVPALFLGLWVGATIAVGLSVGGAWSGLLDAFQVYVLGAFANEDHGAIILFSFMIGGMVGIISRNGGMQGVVNRIVVWASTPGRGQLAAGVLGVAIFFDDYANSLVVGNTMRPVTDRLNISREKLAYIVDSTAAPVTCIALVTTWIGFEVGLIGDALTTLPEINQSAYGLFIASIPFSYYPILAILFVFVVALTRKDFGPMYRAELRARTTGQVLAADAQVDEAVADGKELMPIEGKPHRMINAVLPILVLIVGVLAGLYATGHQGPGDTVREIMKNANSYTALMWASLLGVLVAGTLSVVQGILNVGEVIEAWYAGLKGMLFAMIILILAWSLSSITEVLYTAEYLVTILGGRLNPAFVPTIVFILSAATAFSTGSSWGAMGILLPLVMPLTWAVMVANDMTDVAHYHVLYSSVSCILAGAVWGDHCSPISDTTILSSMASGCDHIAHVRTQLPYAITVGSVGILFGTIPAGFGLPWWVGMLFGAAVLIGGLSYFGKSADDPDVSA